MNSVTAIIRLLNDYDQERMWAERRDKLRLLSMHPILMGTVGNLDSEREEILGIGGIRPNIAD